MHWAEEVPGRLSPLLATALFLLNEAVNENHQGRYELTIHIARFFDKVYWIFKIRFLNGVPIWNEGINEIPSLSTKSCPFNQNLDFKKEIALKNLLKIAMSSCIGNHIYTTINWYRARIYCQGTSLNQHTKYIS